jgi:hypothetical protein
MFRGRNAETVAPQCATDNTAVSVPAGVKKRSPAAEMTEPQGSAHPSSRADRGHCATGSQFAGARVATPLITPRERHLDPGDDAGEQDRSAAFTLSRWTGVPPPAKMVGFGALVKARRYCQPISRANGISAGSLVRTFRRVGVHR